MRNSVISTHKTYTQFCLHKLYNTKYYDDFITLKFLEMCSIICKHNILMCKQKIWQPQLNPLIYGIILFKNSVRTAKKTPHFSVTNINRLTLFKEITAVYSEDNTKPINIFCGQNAELLDVKAGLQSRTILLSRTVSQTFPFRFRKIPWKV
jgi:hypothetical protein